MQLSVHSNQSLSFGHMKASAVVHQLIHAIIFVQTNIEVVSTTEALRLHRRTTTKQRIAEVDQDQARQVTNQSRL